MSARGWLNLGLAVLLIGLALLAWKRPGNPQPEEHRLTSLEPDAITRIRVERPERPAIEFRRRGGKWWLASPIELPANEVRVSNLLELASKTSDSVYTASELDLKQYGLAAPKVRVRLNDQTIAFGNINPLNYLRYVQVGDVVSLISDNLYDLDTAEAASYAALQLLPPDTKIEALTLPELKLGRRKDGQWQSSPNELSKAEIENLLHAWQEAQAYDATPYEKNQAARPAATVEVSLANDRNLDFNVIASEQETIVARPDVGIAYHLRVEAADSLLYPAPASAPESPPADSQQP
jgi:hypothetical protein